MLDLSVAKKLGTPFDITEILKAEGWDASQVTRVWRVSTGPEVPVSWNLDTLRMLGGNDIQAEVWQKLKSKQLTGNPKRTRDADHANPKTKKARVADDQEAHSSSKGKIDTIVGKPEAASILEVLCGRKESQSTPKQESKEEDQKSRKKKKLKKPSCVATPKITRWFQSPARALPEDPLSPIPPAINGQGKMMAKKKKRSLLSKPSGSPCSSNKILFPTDECLSLPSPAKEADSLKIPNQTSNSEQPASAITLGCPSDTKPNLLKRGRRSLSTEAMIDRN